MTKYNNLNVVDFITRFKTKLILSDTKNKTYNKIKQCLFVFIKYDVYLRHFKGKEK